MAMANFYVTFRPKNY